MSRHKVINAPASIRDKLLHKSRATKRPFLELLQYYSIERFLYRLSMVKKGMSNSRMKDFFDIWTLSKQISFDNKTLAAAIQATFHQRGTPIHSSPECFSKEFATHPMKNAQWRSFIHKNQLGLAPDTFAGVVDHIRQFLVPILQIF